MSAIMRILRHFRQENGQNLVELALSLPVILLILAGAIDGGRMLHAYTVMHNAGREASLAGAETQLTSTQLHAIVTNEMNRGGVFGGTLGVTVSYQEKGDPAQNNVSIDLTYQMPMSMLAVLIPSVTLTVHTEMVFFG